MKTSSRGILMGLALIASIIFFALADGMNITFLFVLKALGIGALVIAFAILVAIVIIFLYFAYRRMESDERLAERLREE